MDCSPLSAIRPTPANRLLQRRCENFVDLRIVNTPAVLKDRARGILSRGDHAASASMRPVSGMNDEFLMEFGEWATHRNVEISTYIILIGDHVDQTASPDAPLI